MVCSFDAALSIKHNRTSFIAKSEILIELDKFYIHHPNKWQTWYLPSCVSGSNLSNIQFIYNWIIFPAMLQYGLTLNWQIYLCSLHPFHARLRNTPTGISCWLVIGPMLASIHQQYVSTIITPELTIMTRTEHNCFQCRCLLIHQPDSPATGNVTEMLSHGSINTGHWNVQ